MGLAIYLAKIMRNFGLLVTFSILFSATLMAHPKSSLSLAQEAEIYSFAYEALGQQIQEIPEAWRVVAERHGVEELKRRLQSEIDAQNKDKEETTSSNYLEVRAVPFDKLY